MNKYTRVTATAGKSYLCGCDLQHVNLGTWQDPNRVPRDRCHVHDQPVAGAPVEPEPVGPSINELVRTGVLSRHAYDPTHSVHCECNHVPETPYGILEN